jgi:hypothetical protein
MAGEETVISRSGALVNEGGTNGKASSTTNSLVDAGNATIVGELEQKQTLD